MADIPETEISRAVRADAEDARAEIRAAGIICPSCGVNMADLPRDHTLVFTNDKHPDLTESLLASYAECADGQRICLLNAGFGAVKAAANVSLLDQYNAAMDAEFSKMLGWDIRGETPPPKYTGLPGVLKAEQP